MKLVLLLCLVVSLASSAPLYGADGGYKGFASYVPLQNALSRAGHSSEDSIDASAGSPEVIRRPSNHDEGASHASGQNNLPKKYDVLDYTPRRQHGGYGNNEVSEDSPASPYHRAVLYGQTDGGYKMADTYQNQDVDSHENSAYGSEDEHYSAPQPYEYGYALKDEHGNTQHRHESSDGHGNVKGAYGFTDEHGMYRSVEYVAGKDGFRASIKTNEPGTENQDPADVHVEADKSDHS